MSDRCKQIVRAGHRCLYKAKRDGFCDSHWTKRYGHSFETTTWTCRRCGLGFKGSGRTCLMSPYLDQPPSVYPEREGNAMTKTHDDPTCPCNEFNAKSPSETYYGHPRLDTGSAGFLVPEAENVSSSLLAQNSPISVNGHLLYTEQNCSIFHDNDKQCPVCEGGLAVCRLCGEYEAGLDEQCRKAQPAVIITIPTFEQEWQDAPKWATRTTEEISANYWFIRGQHAKEVELLAGMNCDLREMVRVARERIAK